MGQKKKKITLEYALNCSVPSLYAGVSTDLGLEGWFADRVVSDGNRFTFFWHKTPQQAEMTAWRENKYVRFRWDDEEDPDAYFELSITPHELTGEVALAVTDFAEPGEYDDTIQLWNNNIRSLKRCLGCR